LIPRWYKRLKKSQNIEESDFPGLPPVSCKTYIFQKLYSGFSFATINKRFMYLKLMILSDMISAHGQKYNEDILGTFQSITCMPILMALSTWTYAIQLWITHGLQLTLDISIILARNLPLIRPVWMNETVEYAWWLFSPIRQMIYEHVRYSTWKNGLKVSWRFFFDLTTIGLVCTYWNWEWVANEWLQSGRRACVPENCTIDSFLWEDDKHNQDVMEKH